MKKIISLVAIVASSCIPSLASADPLTVGGSVDLGVPDGLGVGVVVQPWTHMLRVGASFQDNYVAPGLRASLVFAPIKFPIAPQLEIDGGWFSRQNLPFAINGSKDLNVQYDYMNFLFGIALGNRDGFSFTMSGGVSYIAANVGNLSQALNVQNISAKNPSFDGFIPSAKLGFVFFF